MIIFNHKLYSDKIISEHKKKQQNNFEVVFAPDTKLQLHSENINFVSSNTDHVQNQINVQNQNQNQDPPTIHKINSSNKNTCRSRLMRLYKSKIKNLRRRIKNYKNQNDKHEHNSTGSNEEHKIKKLDVRTGEDLKFYGIFDMENVKTIGYLTLISGGINSLLEGIIIGIVFNTGRIQDIIPTVIAILLGLIPKRVGDAGLLLYSGFTIWGVVFWNTAVNIFILLGTGIGLLVGGIDNYGHYYALSFVAGGFLYIALSEMVPIKVAASGFLNIFLQTAFLILGLGAMYIMILLR